MSSRKVTFGEQLSAAIRDGSLRASTFEVGKHRNVYTSGERTRSVYLIERGQVKTVVCSSGGKECLLSIYTVGEVFGELCLLNRHRAETAIAMTPTVVKTIPGDVLIAGLARGALLEDYIRYLTFRLFEQQQAIANLVTVDSEQRLAATLLQLGRKLGKKGTPCLRIDERISQEELSRIVGTTRSRVGYFLKRFRNLGLIETTPESFLIIREKRLSAFLEGASAGVESAPY